MSLGHGSGAMAKEGNEMQFRIKNLLLLILLSLLTGLSAKAQQEAPVDVVKIDTDLVVLRVAVTDQHGRAAVGLRQDAFKVYEDGVQQEVGFFSSEESPISWGLVLDRSGSMVGMMGDVHRAALHVIDEGTSRDEMFIVTFNKKAELISDFTSDRHRLENSTLGLRADGETALYDAVAFALDQLKRAKYRKKVLVVITDGEDNASRLNFRRLVERAEEEEALIYAVGMFQEMGGLRLMDRSGETRVELEKLAEVTGSTAHFPTNVKECREVMDGIALEVSQQYSLGYYPLNKTRDGKWRRIKVAVGQTGSSAKIVARTRSGYYGRKEEPQN